MCIPPLTTLTSLSLTLTSLSLLLQAMAACAWNAPSRSSAVRFAKRLLIPSPASSSSF
jgi:hypothetical protein